MKVLTIALTVLALLLIQLDNNGRLAQAVKVVKGNG